MKIGIISDTHDHAERIARALEIFRAEGVERLIHGGDMTLPQTALLFQDIPTHAVVGNCDADPFAIEAAIQKSGGRFHGISGQMLIDELKIAWTHGHEKKLLHHLENSGNWDYVFHGHTHVRRLEKIGNTTVINPGAIQRVGVPTVGVLDTVKREYRTIEVEA